MLPTIAKTIITTVDVMLAAPIVLNLRENNQQTIGTGVALFAILNIFAIWL